MNVNRRLWTINLRDVSNSGSSELQTTYLIGLNKNVIYAYYPIILHKIKRTGTEKAEFN